jgi:putative resolvase
VAHAKGIHVTTAYRWYREGTLPVPARNVGRLILVSPRRPSPWPRRGAGPYARVSSHDQKADLDRQVGRLPGWAAQTGLPVVRVQAGVGSGMNGARARARRLLADPAAGVIVLEEGEVTGDMVRDKMEVLTSFCARLYGRRSARNRGLEAVGCARRDVGPLAVLTAGRAWCGGAG